MSPSHAWLATESAWWWPQIADHLWQTTVFALLIFAATSALRRGSARVRHTLWIVASLKLLVPSAFLVFLAEGFGFNLLTIMTSVLRSGQDAFLFQSISKPVSMISNSYELTVFSSAASKHVEFYCALTVIWLLGALSLLLVWAVRRRRFLRVLSLGQELNDGREWEIFSRAKASLGLTTNVDLILARCRTEPTVARVWRPVVMLPESICEHLNDQELEAIMLHELVHVQRRDNLIGNLQMIVCAFMWFYPPVWFISRKLINEREQACDEKVLKVGSPPEAYASSILKVLRFSFGWKVAGVSGAGNGSNLSRRIKNIMSSNKTKRGAASLRLLAGLLIGLALVLMVATGVNTRARSNDTSTHQGSDSANLYQRMISSLVQNQRRSTPPSKTQPVTPAQPAQPSVPGQPAQSAPPTPPPAQPAQPGQPAPPSQPSVALLPGEPAQLPTLPTPPSPATAPAPPAPPSQDKEDEKVKVDKGNLIEAPHPTYPAEARAKQISGTVQVSIVIGEDGNVVSAKADSGPEPLRAAAVEAAYKARFKVSTMKGKAVKVAGKLSYDFVLDDC